MTWQRVLLLLLGLNLPGCGRPPGGWGGASGFWLTLWWPTAPVVLLLLFGVFCAQWAKNVGRNPRLWFLLGVLFHVIAVLVLLGKHAGDRSRGSRGPADGVR